MKLIKTFAIFALIFAANTLSAQSVASKWPAMKTYEEVITRINNGVEQGNLNVIAQFSGTLNNFSQELTAKAIPTQFNDKKIVQAVADLQALTQKLNGLVVSKAATSALTPVYNETFTKYRQVINLMQNTK